MLQCLQYCWLVDEYTLRKHVLIQKMLILKKEKRKNWKNNAVRPVQNYDEQQEMQMYEADQNVGKASVTWRVLLLHASEWRE